jgi:dihydrofolate reductase
MRRLIVFNQVTLDGYFTDKKGDMSWAHKSDPEWDAFVAGNSKQGGVLLFGRVTYEMMASYWPTPAAKKAFPDVAEGMNALKKVVLSRSLDKAEWENTTILKELSDVEKLKKEPGPDIVILGSGKVVAQLAAKGWIDEYQLIYNPIALGAGRTLFDGVDQKVELKRTSTRAFKNGNVLICYEPA